MPTLPFKAHAARRDACLSHNRFCRVDHEDPGLFQRYVQSIKALHGCSSSMLAADAHGKSSNILVEQLPPGPEPQSLHLSEKEVSGISWL
jgi:hypothetical protein